MDDPSGKRVRLGPGGEFDLIRGFPSWDGALPGAVVVGPGDDCAVVDASPLALTIDMVVEDVHFKRAWLSPEEVGARACAAATSDLAAVAARPLALLVSLAVAEEDARSGWASAVMEGVRRAAAEEEMAVVGGDLTRSPGPAVLDVAAVGRVETPVLRRGARPGDEVWVTGTLGGAAGAVALLGRGEAPPPGLRGAFARPVPRWREALWLRDRAGLRAMIDLSDGLAGDAGHLAAASDVAVELDAAALPLAPGLEAAAPSAGERTALALGGGEDYELCLVVPPGLPEEVPRAFLERFGIALTRVGRVVEGEGVWIARPGGSRERAGPGGFSHFAEGTEPARGAEP